MPQIIDYYLSYWKEGWDDDRTVTITGSIAPDENAITKYCMSKFEHWTDRAS